MTDKVKIGPVEVREVATEYHETGVGVSPRTDTDYQIGAVVGGKWVSFGSIAASRLESLPDDESKGNSKTDKPNG